MHIKFVKCLSGLVCWCYFKACFFLNQWVTGLFCFIVSLLETLMTFSFRVLQKLYKTGSLRYHHRMLRPTKCTHVKGLVFLLWPISPLLTWQWVYYGFSIVSWTFLLCLFNYARENKNNYFSLVPYFICWSW